MPDSTIAYSGVPTSLTISGGTGPYRAFSSNSALLPVTPTVPGKTVVLLAGNVDIDTTVTITVQDAATLQPVASQVPVTVTVRPAALGNLISVAPNLTECGTAICSGQTGIASATLLDPQGVPIAGRAVRFDVLGTAYAIAINTAQPFVTSLIVVSDANGVASVIVRANAGAATQFAQLLVTDLTSGQQRTLNFVIQQVVDGTQVLSVVPDEANITGAFKGECSAGFRTDYFIYGGTPPYRVSSTFPASVTLVNSIVNANGGFFEAITNGGCVDPLTFTIVDATGRQTTASLDQRRGNGRPAGDCGAGPRHRASGGRGYELRRQDVLIHRHRRYAPLQRPCHAVAGGAGWAGHPAQQRHGHGCGLERDGHLLGYRFRQFQSAKVGHRNHYLLVTRRESKHERRPRAPFSFGLLAGLRTRVAATLWM